MKSGKGDISEDIYVGFVRSLFLDPGILLIGACLHGVVGFLVFLKSGQPAFLLLALLMFGAGLYRYIAIRRVDAASIQSYEHALQRERYYLMAGTIQGAFVGIFAFFCIYVYPDDFSQIAAIGVVMGGAITIAGRNHGSTKMVAILSITTIGPIAAALIIQADFYKVVLGLFIVPFMFIVMKMAELVRVVLFAAISEEKKAKRLAQRFDRALNTMSHGLVMLGPDGRVVVANSQAATFMRISSADRLLGRSLDALLMRSVAGGLLSRSESQFVGTQLTRALREGRDRKLLVPFANGRHMEFSAREGTDDLGVVIFEDVTSRIEAEEKVRYMARYDRLTGLPNRGYFYEIVAEAMAQGDPDRYCALVVFDLDDFKSINDTLGHPVGDGLIYAVAEKLSSYDSADVKVSRFGGDEFIIYFDSVADAAELGAALDRIFADMQGEVDVAGHALRYQLSAGAVLSRAADADADGMIVKADLALYKAKERGKKGWCLFEAAMDEAFRNKQIMKADLRSAVEARSLRVAYQPIVTMGSMRIASCEALCRWDHPELGPISPAVFIPLAEEMGIVSEISSFMLYAATEECARWPEHISVSVNLSAKDLRGSEIIAKVEDALRKSGLAPDRLEIEVTETALLDDKSSTGDLLAELKKLGVRIALDDFGTGYSSLSYLHTLPLDKIKIDRSFLIDMTRSERSLELLKGIVNLSRPLGLQVTIEGVETFEQLKILSNSVGPDQVQGFLFGAPLTAAGIRAMSASALPLEQNILPVGRASNG
ncbi:MAG: EAL domain-containing protein [Rhizobiaceae bacterium]|nr:EAL domain-containing protein [Rhizobiaceae bacterium]MCV0408480.1 EAL domain-containing protein [Rhizobiaceae bacterium]